MTLILCSINAIECVYFFLEDILDIKKIGLNLLYIFHCYFDHINQLDKFMDQLKEFKVLEALEKNIEENDEIED